MDVSVIVSKSLYLNGNPPISCLPFIFLPAVIFDKLQYKVLLSFFLFIKHFCFFFTRESDIFHLELLWNVFKLQQI